MDAIELATLRAQKKELEILAKIADGHRQMHHHEFVYDLQNQCFWDLTTGIPFSKESVDILVPPAHWLDAPKEEEEEEEGKKKKVKKIPAHKTIMNPSYNMLVDSMTWAPGEPQIIKDVNVDKNGMYPHQGFRLYNKYREPPKLNGEIEKAAIWVDHVKRLWPEPLEHEYFFNYFAHMLQKPSEKCNAGIVLSGTQGIGKDAALAPIKTAVGGWNIEDIGPEEIFSNYGAYVQTLLLVVNEVKPTKDENNAIDFYNRLKPRLAAPPNGLPVNEKYMVLRYVLNKCRVVLTTNDFLALFVPAEDRRLFVMHSNLTRQWHLENPEDKHHFTRLWDFLKHQNGGGHVADFLLKRDISQFDANGEPPKTVGWKIISNTWDTPEDALHTALERVGRPDILLTDELLQGQFDDRQELLKMLKNARVMGHRMPKEGYRAIPPINSQVFKFESNGKKLTPKKVYIKNDFWMKSRLEEKELYKMIYEHATKYLDLNKSDENRLTSVKNCQF